MTAVVIASCAEHYGLLVDQVLGRSRCRKPVRARHAVMYVLNRRDRMSTPAIGRIMDRDHSTVIDAIRIVEDMRPRDPHLDALVTMLMALPRYHREFERVAVANEVQLELPTAPQTITIPVRRPRNPHHAICTVQRKPKNDLSPDDKGALDRMRGTDRLLIALQRAGYA